MAVQMDKGNPKRETGVIFKSFVFGVFLGDPPKKMPEEAPPPKKHCSSGREVFGVVKEYSSLAQSYKEGCRSRGYRPGVRGPCGSWASCRGDGFCQ